MLPGRSGEGVDPGIDREEGQRVWLTTLGIGLLLLGLLATMVVCSRMNEHAPPPRGFDTPPHPGRDDVVEEAIERTEV